jgi:hypothetical protein
MHAPAYDLRMTLRRGLMGLLIPLWGITFLSAKKDLTFAETYP